MTSPLNGWAADRVAVVTGGSRGVGRATVRRLAARGYAVVVNYVHDQRAADATVETVLADRGAAVAVRADVADEVDVERLFAETTEVFGGVDVVVHAVTGRLPATPVTDVDLDRFDDLCRINTRAAFIVDREAARRVRDGGAIVNLSSAVLGSPVRGHAAVAATTAGIEALTRVLALELGHRHIAVNAVAVDIRCTPDVVAGVVADLLSGDGRGLTGQVIRVADPAWRIRPTPA
jgi:3-oxoacyl-[acyl-carrier protein] reductase